MKITAFLDGESEEPVTVDHEQEVIGADEDPVTLAQWVADVTNTHLDDIHVVSENVATIALHALHGVLKATHTDPESATNDKEALAIRWQQVSTARAWALAALRELAFCDRDGIEFEEDRENPIPVAGLRASDPGREAVDKIRGGTRLKEFVDDATGERTPVETRFYVDWPDA